MSRRTDLPLQSDYRLVNRPDTAGSLHVIPRNSAVHVRLRGTSVTINKHIKGVLSQLPCQGQYCSMYH